MMILCQGKSDDGELFKIPVNTFSNNFVAKLSNCAAFLGKKVQALVWHQRLGHPSEEILIAMIKALDISVSTYSSSCMSMCIYFLDLLMQTNYNLGQLRRFFLDMLLDIKR